MKTLCVLITCCCIAAAQPVRPSFFMGAFRISIESMVVINQSTPPREVQSLPQPTAQPFPGSGGTLQGMGRISINNNAVLVTFSRVVLAYNKIKSRWEATRGSANGTAPTLGSSIDVSYSLGSTKVSINKGSIRVTATSTKAHVTVLAPISIISSEPNLILRLASDSSAIAPDGSIAGNNFRGHHSFHLKGTPDSIVIPQTAEHIVCLGQAFTSQYAHGVRIRGRVYRGGLNLFSFQGVVSHTAQQASLRLSLLNPLDRTPELGYSLRIKSGKIDYEYASSGMTSCSGSFTVDLKLPDINRTLSGSVCTLRNITLKTDTSGALFNTVSIADTFEIARVFRVAADTTFIYFPHWMLPDPPGNYLGFDKVPPCADLMERLRGQRPGVTMTKGILYFKAPQVQGQNPPILKTLYLGALTFTPYGITGELTTANRTFVLSKEDISESKRVDLPPRATWKTILARGDKFPKEPKEKFRLAQLRILEMRIMNLQFCQNEMNEKPTFRYTVHFPLPSFIDLEFEDRSLDANGIFYSAVGPVVSHGWSYSRDEDRAAIPTLRRAYMSGTLLKTLSQNPLPLDSTSDTQARMWRPTHLPNPDTHILWAYRLPVSFAEQGVSIAYSTTRKVADIKIRLDTLLNTLGELVSNELWIPRLYSKNSGIKKGVRFGGTLDSLGNFQVKELDKNPTFVRAYAKPGTERKVGLECKLKNIQITGPLNRPAERKSDFYWNGELEFPFFGWQGVEFSVRNVIPALIDPTSLTNSKHMAVTCRDTVEIRRENAASLLNVTAGQLQYSFTSNSFISKKVTAKENGNVLTCRSLELLSFTNAWLLLDSEVARDIFIKAPTSTCGTEKVITQRLLDAMPSSSRRDLVCYDTAAYRMRDLTGVCCSDYYIGTFAVIETSNGKSDTTILAPKTAWYPSANRLVMQNSEMALKSGNQNGGDKSAITLLPGAKLMITDSSIVGIFGGAFDVLGESCGAEFRFFVNTNCGYFYVLAAVQFPIYSFTFDGEIFIVHAPIEQLEKPPPFPGVSSVLEDVACRALTNGPCLKQYIGIKGLDATTIVSGVLIAGGVSTDYSIVRLTAAAGISYMQYQEGGRDRVIVAGFMNAEASANLYVVEAKGYVHLDGQFGPDEFRIAGNVCIEGCVSVLIGHCSCEIRADAAFSSKTGFDIGGLDISPSCDWGPCTSACVCLPPDCSSEQ
ncbi:MAG: hypothetical protein Q8P51_10920 [Ignavibacteria bacterium]|nr:hypothetical protein [Ignavibacteria bacterium]